MILLLQHSLKSVVNCYTDATGMAALCWRMHWRSWYWLWISTNLFCSI